MSKSNQMPGVESLESRQLLSVSLSPAGRLLVAGARGAPNAITVGLSADGTSVNVLLNGNPVQSFDASAVKKLTILGGKFNDNIRIDEATRPFDIKTKVFTKAGDDTVVGGAENDTVFCGRGNDSITGGAGRNKLVAKSGNSTLVGGSGTDSLFGGSGADSLVCGGGADVAVAGSGPNKIEAPGATDTVVGNGGNDQVFSGGGAIVFRDPSEFHDPFPTRPVPVVPTPPPALDSGQVHGVVNGADGKPVDKAFVFLRTVEQPGGHDFLIAAAFGTTTNAQGVFDLSHVPVGAYVVVAGKKGAGYAQHDVTVTKDTTVNVTLQLQQPAPPPIQGTGMVAGTVTDSGGAVVVGADVTLVRERFIPVDPPIGVTPDAAALNDALPGIAIGFPGFGLHAITDGKGGFLFDKAPAGNYVAIVFKPDVGFAHQSVTVTADKTTTVDVKLNTVLVPPPVTDVGTVEGTAVDASNQPVDGASILLVRTPIEPQPLFGIPTGGMLPVGFPPVGFPPVGSPPTTPVNLPPIQIPPIGESIQATTDAKGHFSAADVPVGTYEVLANKEGVGTGRAQVVVTKGSNGKVSLTLKPEDVPPPVTGSGEVTGTVDDKGGTPVSGAVVALLPRFSFHLTAALFLPRILHTSTDAKGAFDLKNVSAGDYSVIVSKDGGGFATADVTVADGKTSTVSITLDPAHKPEPLPMQGA